MSKQIIMLSSRYGRDKYILTLGNRYFNTLAPTKRAQLRINKFTATRSAEMLKFKCD